MGIMTTSSSTRPVRTRIAAEDNGGVIHFGIAFEDYNLDEDRNSDDPDAQERYQEFLALGNGDETQAALKCEDLFMAELAKKFSQALGRSVTIGNEGHNDYELVCKFSVQNKDELKKAVDAIHRMSYNNEGSTASMAAPYVEAGNWQVQVWGPTSPERNFDFDRDSQELEEYLEGSTTASVKHAAKDPYVCLNCGGERVQQTMWVDLNTNEVIDEAFGDEYFCPECESTETPKLLSEIKKKDPKYQKKTSSLVPNGVYTGTWKGYGVTVVAGNKKLVFRTASGIRGATTVRVQKRAGKWAVTCQGKPVALAKKSKV